MFRKWRSVRRLKIEKKKKKKKVVVDEYAYIIRSMGKVRA